MARKRFETTIGIKYLNSSTYFLRQTIYFLTESIAHRLESQSGYRKHPVNDMGGGVK